MMRVMVPVVAVPMVVTTVVAMAVAMVVRGRDTDAANMVVMARLHRAAIALVAHDLRAILAELAIHRRLAIDRLMDAVDEAVEHQGMVAEIGGLQELDLAMVAGDPVDRGINALHQHAGEKEIREDDDAAEAQPDHAPQSGLDQGICHTAERRLHPAEAQPFAQHAGELRYIGIGVGIVGAAPDHEEEGVAAIAWPGGLRLGFGDAVGGGAEQLGLDRKLAPEAQVELRVLGAEAIDLPG